MGNTIAGMEFLPNPNYYNALMFTDIVEELEIMGPFPNFRKLQYNKSVTVEKLPVLFYINKFGVGSLQDTALTKYNSMMFGSVMDGNFFQSQWPVDLPLTGPNQPYCHTRGNVAQTLWWQVETNLEQLGNVRVLSRFEEFNTKVTDYDKSTICFYEDRGQD